MISNPLTSSPTDVLTPNAPALPKNAPGYMNQVLEAHKQAGELAAKESEVKAEQGQMLAEGTTKAVEQYAKEREPEALKSEYDKRVEDLAKPFIPTERTAGDLGLIFTLTNILGFGIGRGVKGNAQAALAAQNGMLEGWQKGDMDAYKKQKDIFEENQKALGKAVEGLRDELARAEKTASTNKDLAMAQVNEAIAKHGADTIGQFLKTHPLSKAVDLLDDYAKMMDTIDKRSMELRKLANDDARLQLEREKVEKEKQQKVTQQQFRAQSIVNAANGVASAAEQLMKLPAGTTTGVLPNLQTKDGMINYMRNSALRKISPAEAKTADTLFKGVSRNLAAIEASGAATGLVGLATSLESLAPKAGDTAFDTAIKMADIRRITIENIQPMIEAGLLPKQQAETALNVLERVKQAIPFTTDDVMQARFAGRQTIAEKSQELVHPPKSFATEAEAEAAAAKGELQAGEKISIGGKRGTWSNHAI
jgi:hypothetical protein